MDVLYRIATAVAKPIVLAIIAVVIIGAAVIILPQVWHPTLYVPGAGR